MSDVNKVGLLQLLKGQYLKNYIILYSNERCEEEKKNQKRERERKAVTHFLRACLQLFCRGFLLTQPRPESPC